MDNKAEAAAVQLEAPPKGGSTPTTGSVRKMLYNQLHDARDANEMSIISAAIFDSLVKERSVIKELVRDENEPVFLGDVPLWIGEAE